MRFNTSIDWRESRSLRKITVLLGSFILATGSFANPEGGVVTSGSAAISQTQTTTTIQQSTDKAIINWQSFNIAPGEKTQFVQPSQSSVTLNRINPSQGASQIFGQLSSNGQIILVNQAGIFFGSGAAVNVGGIIASTSDISDANFLAGKFVFDTPSSFNGSVINKGAINVAEYGLAALMGTSVANSGVIQAHLGNIVLASGNKFTVNFSGDGLVNFSVDEAATHAGVDQNGNSLKNGVTNTGTLIADGGTILLTGKAAQGVVDNVIGMAGVAQAQSVDGHDGDIILSGDDENTVQVDALLDASGANAGLSGGTIKILGEKIVLLDATNLNVSGDAGGGTILVGGNFHGAGPEQNAFSTYVSTGAILDADAITSGNGGNVAVWSNNDTEFHGMITARGGATSGNGGKVETSGEFLNVHGAIVNLLAPHGQTGSWLLDPSNLIICTACSTTANNSGNTYSAGASDSYLLVSDLTTALNSANITIQTTSGGAASAGDILVNTPIVWNSSFSLTMSAYRNIDTTGIAASSGDIIKNSGSGAVNLVADNSGTGTGTVLFNAGNDVLAAGGVSIYYNPTVFGTQDTIYSGGTTPTEYMLINSLGNAADTTTASLASLSNNSSLWASGLNYALSANIDATATSGWNGTAGFSPIGNDATPFLGSFDGQNFTITNLYIKSSSDNIGLFGLIGDGVSSTAIIQNLSFINPVIIGSNSSAFYNAGVLAGTVQAGNVGDVIINNVSTTGGSVTGQQNFNNNYTGGLIGTLNTATLTNSHNSSTTVNMNAGYGGGLVGNLSSGLISYSYNAATLNNNQGLVGGLVGIVQGTGPQIANSYNSGTINANVDGAMSGGIAAALGWNFEGNTLTPNLGVATVINSYNTGQIVSSHANLIVGGIAGNVDATTNDVIIQNSYNTGTFSITSGSNDDVGGLVGFTSGNLEILSSFNAGAINGIGRLGGLIGDTHYSSGPTQITDSFNTGAVTGNGTDHIGGLVGWVSNTTVQDSYNLGAVTAGADVGGIFGVSSNDTIISSFNAGLLQGSGNVGGLIGSESGDTVTNSYWDKSTSGQNTSAGSLGTGVVTASLQSALPTGFSGSTWGIAANMYPYLLNFYSTTPTVISGTMTGSVGDIFQLVGNGSAVATSATSLTNLTLGQAATGNNGYYYFIESNGAIANGTDVLVYSPLGNQNAVGAVTNGAANQLGTAAAYTISVGTATMSNTDLVNALGSYSDAGIDYTAPGSVLSVNFGAGFTTTANTSYTITGGTLGSNTLGAIDFQGTLVLPATTTLNGTNINLANITGAGFGLVLDDSAASSISGNFSGTGSTLTQSGGGALTLSGANSYTGATTISSGSIVLGAANALPTGTALSVAGTLDLNGHAQQVASVTGAGTVTDGGAAATFTINNSSSNSFAGLLTGSLALKKSGSGTLTLTNGSNTYSGATQVLNGIFAPSSAGALGNTANVTVSSGGELDIGNFTLGSSITYTLSGSGVSGNGALYDTATSGTATVSGNVTVNGATTIGVASGGTLALNGALEDISSGNSALTLAGSGGTISFGSAVGALNSFASLVSNSGVITQVNGNASTTGAQTYNGVLVVNAPVNLTASSVAINQGVSGAGNLTLTGFSTGNNNFSLAGPITVSSIIVNGNNTGTNSLTYNNNGAAQTWNITGANSGNVDSLLTFNHISNVTGGAGNDTVTINGGSLSGLLDGSGGTNTFGSSNTIYLTGATSGYTYDPVTFSNFSVFNGNIYQPPTTNTAAIINTIVNTSVQATTSVTTTQSTSTVTATSLTNLVQSVTGMDLTSQSVTSISQQQTTDDSQQQQTQSFGVCPAM